MPPSLDQFDMDEQLASQKLRLAHLTNKCTAEDLEYYVRESGEILGITNEMQSSDENEGEELKAKRILEHIMKKLVGFKMFNQDLLSMQNENDSTIGNGSEQRRNLSSPNVTGNAQFAKPIQREDSKEGKYEYDNESKA